MSIEAHVSPAAIEPLAPVWTIGLYQGGSPLELAPVKSIIHASDVTDVPATFVADPFHLRVDGLHYAFFEVWNQAINRGEIACASSPDLHEWHYRGVVLREPFHLSYPCVFTTDEGIFMVPETRETQSVRLYQSEGFPGRWRPVAELLRGDFADATPFHYRNRWWLFVHRGLDELNLFVADHIHGPFRPHPASPIVAGSRRISRPAGRVVELDGQLWRFAQDAWPRYGTAVRALRIDLLTASRYEEHEVEQSPVLNASGKGWNALGMHHLELVPADDGLYAIVDGQASSAFQAP